MAKSSDFEASDLEEDTGELSIKSIDCFRNEPIDSEIIQRCKKCQRLKYGHSKPFGETACKLKRIENDDELRLDDEQKNLKRFENRKRKSMDDEEEIDNEIEEARKQQDELRKRLEISRSTKRKEQESLKRKKLEKIQKENEKIQKEGEKNKRHSDNDENKGERSKAQAPETPV